LCSLTDKQTLPTYNWLSNAGITPSTSKTFSLSTLTSALESASGVTPSLDCNGDTLNAISWYFNLKGSIIDGQFVPVGALIGEWTSQCIDFYHRCYRAGIVPFVGYHIPTQVWFWDNNICKFTTSVDVDEVLTSII
jgi:hypothetical protein